jgi:hypothetical protein
MRPRLREARLVEDQNARALGHHGAETAPDHLGIPRRMGDEMLKLLIRTGGYLTLFLLKQAFLLELSLLIQILL